MNKEELVYRYLRRNWGQLRQFNFDYVISQLKDYVDDTKYPSIELNKLIEQIERLKVVYNLTAGDILCLQCSAVIHSSRATHEQLINAILMLRGRKDVNTKRTL